MFQIVLNGITWWWYSYTLCKLCIGLTKLKIDEWIFDLADITLCKEKE